MCTGVSAGYTFRGLNNAKRLQQVIIIDSNADYERESFE